MYWWYMQKRKIREAEDQIRLMWGEVPSDKAKASMEKKELAEKWQEDPLYGFPDDIGYLDSRHVGIKLRITKRFGEKLAPEKRWDQERADSCLGKRGVVARRCSMNDALWEKWRQSITEGNPLRLETVRKMVQCDILRSKLYPPGWTDDKSPPPSEHLEKLRQEGKLEPIYTEIDGLFSQ